MSEILVDGEVVKEYIYELQAITYCFMNGYISRGRGYYFLNTRVKILED